MNPFLVLISKEEMRWDVYPACTHSSLTHSIWWSPSQCSGVSVLLVESQPDLAPETLWAVSSSYASIKAAGQRSSAEHWPWDWQGSGSVASPEGLPTTVLRSAGTTVSLQGPTSQRSPSCEISEFLLGQEILGSRPSINIPRPRPNPSLKTGLKSKHDHVLHPNMI